jgi:hypothetical protein
VTAVEKVYYMGNGYLLFEQKVTLEVRIEILAADVLKVRSSGQCLYVEWYI